MIYNWKKIVRFSLPLLTVCALIEIFAGHILLYKQNTLILYPIFLISIPVINSVGGNIGSVLGARLASGLHVGYISISLNDKKMHNNLFTAIMIGLIMYIILGVIIYFFYYLAFSSSNIEVSIDLINFVIIILGTGFSLVCIVSVLSVFTAFWSFKKGLDPDDIVAPVVTTVGDVFGLLFLFLYIGIVGF